LGGWQLQAITAKVITRQFVAAMRRAGAGDATIVYALAVLQSVLSFAVAEGRIVENPVRAVRKPSKAVERDVPPVAPAQVEAMRVLLRARSTRTGVRDAAIISLLAYEGLRPEEVLALEVDDIGQKLRVRRKNVDGSLLSYTKTRRKRSVPWSAPVVRQDVNEYLLATGIRRGLLFPRADGEPWRKHDYDNWRKRVYQPVARKVELPKPRPYDLRGSYVSLLAAEGYTLLEVSRYAGHSVQTCETYYAKIFDDVDPANRLPAEQAIRAAREPGVSGVARLFDIAGGTS
jgi:integrase